MLGTDQFPVIEVNLENANETGFFCKRRKRESLGFRQKMDWVTKSFKNGLKIKIMNRGNHQFGFIEYIPGEYAWRVVEAPDFMVIHCLWVIGPAKEKGIGKMLGETCMCDARSLGKKGVVIVTTRGHWPANKELFVQMWFETTSRAPPSFELLVKNWSKDQNPVFPDDWLERLANCPQGITIFRSSQCPYEEDSVQAVLTVSKELGIGSKMWSLR